MPPIIDQLYQSTDTVAVNGTVELVVSAHDPESAALTFAWSADSGTLGVPVTSASQNYYSANPTAGTAGAGGHNVETGGGIGLNGGVGFGTIVGGGGTAGGSAGGNGDGLGANTWSTATTLPAAAGTGSTGGGNAGLVILTYTAPTCML